MGAVVPAAHAAPVDGVPVVSWPVMEEYVAGEDLVLLLLLGPVSEPVRVLHAGRPNVAVRPPARSSWATSTECRGSCPTPCAAPTPAGTEAAAGRGRGGRP
ncbi:hypothetical protein AMK28_19170 [Streptomyces sp. CB02115]|nr:hypothetical protein AMK28_19170 [Streptomyces sp. CB02115]